MDITTTFPDPKTEQSGVWVPYRDGAELHLARVGNPRFQEKLDRLMRPYRDMQRRGRLADQVELKMLCQAMVGTVLLGWRGFTAGGKPFDFSEENATLLLTTRMDFRNDVTALATDVENFRTAALEETAGD